MPGRPLTGAAGGPDLTPVGPRRHASAAAATIGVALVFIVGVAVVGGLAETALPTAPSVSQSPLARLSPTPRSVRSSATPAAPTPTATPTAPAATPTDTLPPALAGLPEVTVSGSQPLTSSGWTLGTESYTIDWSTTGAVLTYVGAGATGSVPLPVTKGETTARHQGGMDVMDSLSGDPSMLAAVISESVGPPSEGGTPCSGSQVLPHAWRILVAPLDAHGTPGQFVPFAAGTARTVFAGPAGGEGCAETAPPAVAVDGGRIAYSLDAPTAANPVGSRILVRSLATGATERVIDTPTRVLDLQLSGTTVAWLEAAAGYPTRLPLRISTAAHPAAADVTVFTTPGGNGGWGLPTFSLAGDTLVGDTLAWERFGTGQVWQRELVSGATAQISPTGAVCLLGATEDMLTVMHCGGDPSYLAYNSATAPWLVVWSILGGDRVALGVPPVDSVWLSAGWVEVVALPLQDVSAFPAWVLAP